LAKKKTTEKKVTPLMKQYNAIKAKYPDAVLLFRVGDFYETFGPDAIKASKILGIVLTKRANGGYNEELAGFPHHSLDTYLPKLVRSGQRVAICEQLEDPKMTKKIVKRGVTELVTPGVSYNDKTIETKSNNFLASVHIHKEHGGVAFLDVSTGEFYLAEGKLDYIDKLLQSFQPAEVIYQKQKRQAYTDAFGDQFYSYRMEDWAFQHDFAYEKLTNHFGTKSLKGFGIDRKKLGIVAAGAAMHYLDETQHHEIQHINAITRIEEEQYVWMDRFTIRNLELFQSTNQEAITLIDILDYCSSPMGARSLRRWLALPLKDITAIEERLNAVEYFINDGELGENLRTHIKQIGDLERLISKVATGRINPREVVQLQQAMENIVPIKEFCAQMDEPGLKLLGDQLNACQLIVDRIGKEVQPNAPLLIHKGNIIQEGISAELDEYRGLAHNAKDLLEQIRIREIERTGMSNLKIAFNNVFGYYLEVRNSQKDKVPEEWIRKQTLVNAERYITEELKELETKIISAEGKISEIENKLFNALVFALTEYILPIQQNALLIARLDCYLSFAQVSVRNGYNKPSLNEGFGLDIKDGRHPVIEQNLPLGEQYIANNVYLDNASQQIMMITGPNMSGKSALLRQTALIVLLAQIGCFVPAKSAEIGLVDKIFTRVGASDNISLGESTFMVEMNETASILNNVSDRSLILLDEIGRGTSTYDGISIAWAIAEYLHEHPTHAKTLFATHYHELNEMTELFPRIRNFNVAVKELDNKIIFIRKLQPGGSEHSFGIHVAKMAGMPASLINRANDILSQLESSRSREQNTETLKQQNGKTVDEGMQLSFFQLDDPVLISIKDEITQTDINTLTPVEALMKLNQIKKMIGKQ